jgi:hypothetical protein
MVARCVGVSLWALAGCIGILTPVEMLFLFLAIPFDDKGGVPYFPLLFTPLLAPLLLSCLWFAASVLWGRGLATRLAPWAALCGAFAGLALLGYQMTRMPFFSVRPVAAHAETIPKSAPRSSGLICPLPCGSVGV